MLMRAFADSSRTRRRGFWMRNLCGALEVSGRAGNTTAKRVGRGESFDTWWRQDGGGQTGTAGGSPPPPPTEVTGEGRGEGEAGVQRPPGKIRASF